MANDETPNQETAIRIMRFAILAVVAIAQLTLVLTAAAVGDPRDIRVVLAATTILTLIPSVSVFLATAPDRHWRDLGIRAFIPRLRIRALMLVVVVVAVMMGAVVLQTRIAERASYCREQAKEHAARAMQHLVGADSTAKRIAVLRVLRNGHPDLEALAIEENAHLAEKRRRERDAQAETELETRFERAAKYPWIPLPNGL